MHTGRVERVYSQTLGREVRLWLLDTPNAAGIVYLLHGNGGCCLDWTEQTDIEALAARLGLAVVAPDFEDSYCTNTADGRPWFDYLADELPELTASLLGKTFAPGQRVVAGLSAGGYGALKLAFARPGQFAVCAGLSAVTDMAARIALLPQSRLPQFRPIFGETLQIAPKNDLPLLTRTAAQAGGSLPVFLACGTEDSFLEMNRRYAALLGELGMQHEFLTGPGSHNWEFWQSWLGRAMEWAQKQMTE